MTTCPLCACEGSRRYAVLHGRDFCRCQGCGSIYLSGGELPLETPAIYTEEYIRKRGHDHDDTPLAKSKLATARHYLAMLERHVPRGELLEIGCSTGIALRAARDRAWSVHGVDVNEAAVALARQMLGEDTVFAGELQDAMFPDESFDAVLLLDVIEHIAHPDRFMDVLAGKVRKGGGFFAVTPNAASLSARLLRSRWPHLMLEHLLIYSPRALRDLLSRHGFDTVKCGWAVKFATTESIRRHLLCHPNVLCAAAAAKVLHAVGFMDRLLLPVNIGEMYVFARKQ